jgi:hypothetical protein
MICQNARQCIYFEYSILQGRSLNGFIKLYFVILAQSWMNVVVAAKLGGEQRSREISVILILL